jgi:hypothetical protein
MSISRRELAPCPGSTITSAVSHVRLLGRNGENWTQDEVAADYLYTPQELGRQDRIDRLRTRTNATFV